MSKTNNKPLVFILLGFLKSLIIGVLKILCLPVLLAFYTCDRLYEMSRASALYHLLFAIPKFLLVLITPLVQICFVCLPAYLMWTLEENPQWDSRWILTAVFTCFFMMVGLVYGVSSFKRRYGYIFYTGRYILLVRSSIRDILFIFASLIVIVGLLRFPYTLSMLFDQKRKYLMILVSILNDSYSLILIYNLNF